VHDDRWPKPSNQIENALPIPHVELMVLKARKFSLKAVLIPPCITFRSEKRRPLIVVDAVNTIAGFSKIRAHFAAD
jgi:hypothetical protein